MAAAPADPYPTQCLHLSFQLASLHVQYTLISVNVKMALSCHCDDRICRFYRERRRKRGLFLSECFAAHGFGCGDERAGRDLGYERYFEKGKEKTSTPHSGKFLAR
jgi:hypothetical protein